MLGGFSFTKVQHTGNANTYTHLHNGFHVTRFVMHPEIRRDQRRCYQDEPDGLEEFFLLQRNCQYKEAGKTGWAKFMQRSAGEWGVQEELLFLKKKMNSQI